MTDLDFCRVLGERGFRPYQIAVTNIGRVEYISYPFPEKDGIWINLRTTPGDPTTMKAFRIETVLR